MMNLHDRGEGAAWTVEPLAFQLRSPLHIGWRKVGNLMQTRPYVPARNLWGALTAALTRAEAAQQEQAAAPEDYNKWGQRVAESLAFTYLFPALTADPAQALYPWLRAGGLVYGEEGLAAERFDYLCLDSYASTAIVAGQNSAETGSLHETEMIRPRTRPLGGAADEWGAPLYLVGYVLIRGEGPAGWRTALRRLQIGGERRYGWGRSGRWRRPLSRATPCSADTISARPRRLGQCSRRGRRGRCWPTPWQPTSTGQHRWPG